MTTMPCLPLSFLNCLPAAAPLAQAVSCQGAPAAPETDVYRTTESPVRRCFSSPRPHYSGIFSEREEMDIRVRREVLIQKVSFTLTVIAEVFDGKIEFESLPSEWVPALVDKWQNLSEDKKVAYGWKPVPPDDPAYDFLPLSFLIGELSLIRTA